MSTNATASPPAPREAVPDEPVALENACRGDAVVVVVDKSGSMTGLPFELAKDGVKRVAAKIGKDDCFGLVTFDSAPSRVVKLAPIRERASVDTAISQLAAGGGTEIVGALDVAFQDLKPAKGAKRKLVILLTDGQAPKNGIRPLVETMAGEKMRVSTIGLGPSTDEAMLQMVAHETKGNFRKVVDPAALPMSFEEELAALRR